MTKFNIGDLVARRDGKPFVTKGSCALAEVGAIDYVPGAFTVPRVWGDNSDGYVFHYSDDLKVVEPARHMSDVRNSYAAQRPSFSTLMNPVSETETKFVVHNPAFDPIADFFVKFDTYDGAMEDAQRKAHGAHGDHDVAVSKITIKKMATVTARAGAPIVTTQEFS